MKEQLDLVKILKDCPKGMELDCTMYDNVTLKSVSDDPDNTYPICIEMKCGFIARLTKYGQNACINDAKCVIFPKGKKTWEGFQRPFVDGDILTYIFWGKPVIYIYRENGIYNTSYYVAYSFENNKFYSGGKGALSGNRTDLKFATEEEKKKLFDVIREKGYRWNTESKTLENWTIQNAKDGDVIFYDDGWTCIFKCIHGIWYSSYCFIDSDGEFHMGYEGHAVDSKINGNAHIATKEQRDLLFQTIKEAGYEWNPETKTLEKLIVPKFKVGDKIRLKENHNYIYTITNIREKENKYECGVTFVLRFSEQNNWELIPNKFDPKTLKPFDKVLVRDIGYNMRWHIQFFETMYEDKKKYPFVCWR